ncbi:DUF4232 domain-containing protein [Schumannella sp. 10F1B-5-1]|uniref:DUF4232 domain-containing protein n=1 Tax=Schumannella sp. 10F1B-5-1 TaxID=2590780 RepID=UPI001131C1C4|nr:DUF4232 domain-containing protein [Schumannella sp. 10F1B-5-1]TPW73525.1 DUF4232 domain-containing protein [Schumannella sp. 10F1B-5-1]
MSSTASRRPTRSITDPRPASNRSDRRERRDRRALLAGAAVVAALGLAGCASGGGTSADGSAASAAPGSSSPSPTASASAPAPSPDPQDPDAPAGQCADDELKVAVTEDAGGAAAGSIGYRVSFTNTGSAACELRGYPGVSVVGHGDGTQLGEPAERPGASGPAIEAVDIPVGQSVAASMTVVNLGSDGGALGCATEQGDGWRVYPPHSFAAVFVPDAGVAACDDSQVWMHLTAPVAAR